MNHSVDIIAEEERKKIVEERRERGERVAAYDYPVYVSNSEAREWTIKYFNIIAEVITRLRDYANSLEEHYDLKVDEDGNMIRYPSIYP